MNKEIGLKTTQIAYKPFRYPWAFEAYQKQNQMHWLPEEVPMSDDVKDWNKSLEPHEKNLLTQILRFFTTADIEVSDCYHSKYSSVFKPTEIKMMLGAFSNMESVHINSYSHLIDTLGLPEVEYSKFLEYKAMKDKFDYMHKFDTNDDYNTALTLAAFGGFTEGLQLFASFAILMNFQRFNKMKGVGQIVAFSVRDENLHADNIIKLFHTWCDETGLRHNKELKEEITQICKDIVEHEDAFIDLTYEMGDVQGLSKEEVKLYIRYIADIRLKSLGCKKIYNIKRNPLPWMDEIMSGVEHSNFFETRASGYSKAATTGTWEEAFKKLEGEQNGK